jgi:hypothetical protein
LLIGNPAKAKKKLGWEPKVRFEELIQIMVDADLAMARGSIGKTPWVSVPVPVGVNFGRFDRRPAVS